MEEEIHLEIKNLQDNKNDLRRDMEKNQEEIQGKNWRHLLLGNNDLYNCKHNSNKIIVLIYFVL